MNRDGLARDPVRLAPDDHAICEFCHGTGYWNGGEIADGMMSGRYACPGPFVRPR